MNRRPGVSSSGVYDDKGDPWRRRSKGREVDVLTLKVKTLLKKLGS